MARLRPPVPIRVTERSESLTIQVGERRGNVRAALLALLGVVVVLLTWQLAQGAGQVWQLGGFAVGGALILSAAWTLYVVTTTVTINEATLRCGRQHWPVGSVRGFLCRRWVPKRHKAKEALPVYQLLAIFKDGQEIALLEHRDDQQLTALAAKLEQYLS